MIEKEVIDTEIRTSGFKELQDGILKSNILLDEYSDTLKNLTNERNKSIKQYGKESQEVKNLNAQIKDVNKSIREEKTNRQELRKQLNLDEMSLSQLTKRAKELKGELYQFSKADDQFRIDNTKARLKEVEDQIAKTREGLGLASKDMKQAPSIWSQAWSSVKKGLGIASIGGAIALVATQAKKLVSEIWDLSKQSQADYSRNTRVLGDSYGYVSVMADQLHKQLGLTKNEFINGASAAADYLQQLGLGKDEAAKYGVEIQKLGGILNEWTSGEVATEEATKIVSEALLGQTDRLKNLGIVINKNSEEFKKRKSELKEEKQITDEQAQAMVVLEQIYHKTSSAQDAFAQSGMRLNRIAKEGRTWWQGFKEAIADFFALTREQKLDIRVQEIKALNDMFDEQSQVLLPLIARYEELAAKENLSLKEQTELNEAINKLAQIAPEAVAGYNSMNQAIAINTSRIEDDLDAQKRLNEAREQQAIDKTIRFLKQEATERANTGVSIKYFSNELEKLRIQFDQGEISEKRYGRQRDRTISNFDKYNAKLGETEKSMRSHIETLLTMGVTYDEIATSIGRTVEYVYELDRTFAKIAGTGGAAGALTKVDTGDDPNDEAAKATAKALAESQAKARQAAIRSALEQTEQEKLAFQDRLTQAGISESEITKIIETEAEQRSSIQTEKLQAYEALYAQHQQNLTKIDESERRYRENLINNETEFGKENAEYAQRLKDAGITEEEIIAIRQKSADEQTDIERQKLRTWEILNTQHLANITRIETANIKKWQTEQQNLHNQEMTQLKTRHNEELASIQSLEDAKTLLQDQYGVQDVDRIRNVGDARKAIRKKQQEEEERDTTAFYASIIEQLTKLMDEGTLEGISLADKILTPEESAELQTMLDAVKLKLSELIAAKNGEGEDTDAEKFQYGSIGGGNVDLLGMSAEDWLTMFENIQEGKIGLQEMVAVASMLGNAFQSYYSKVSAAENKRMQIFEQNINKEKEKLKQQLDQKKIRQTTYYAELNRLDAELEKKKTEHDLAQAKREKKQAVIASLINTAVAVTKALPNVPLSITVGILGGIQTALIAAQPVEGKEEGGFINVKREQDGKRFNAEFKPQKRGYIKRPTLISENGPEYVIPTEGLQNPDIAAAVAAIEAARVQGNIRNVNLGFGAGTTAPGRQTGGYTDYSDVQVATNDPRLAALLEKQGESIDQLNRLLQNGIPAYVAMLGPRGLVEQTEEYEKVRNRSRG